MSPSSERGALVGMLSELDTALCSASAPVTRLVSAVLDAVPGTHVLRDPTRGGLATALCEIALASPVGIRVEDADVPLRSEVRGACELLGFDPLYVACGHSTFRCGSARGRARFHNAHDANVVAS